MKRKFWNYLVFTIWSVLLSINFSCESTESVEDIQIETDSTSSIKFIAFGDSYTIGHGIDSVGKWPVQLINRLKENDYKVDSLQVFAKTGWSTTLLLQALQENTIKDFNLVSLQVGVNNQYLDRPFSTFEKEFIQLLDTAERITGNRDRIFVLSIPDYGVTPFGADEKEKIALEIDNYNAYIQKVCNERGILLIDVTSISRQLADGSLALAEDQLHPSAYQYSQWVNKIYPEIEQIVSE